jgi:putative oxidoreductase
LNNKKIKYMKEFLKNPYLILIARLVLGYIFITFGISKIADPAGFAQEINNYGMLPKPFLNIAALIMPWLELICGILIVFGVKLRANSVIVSGLLIVFIVAVAIAWSQGLDINCGCSSTNPQKVGLPKLASNTGLLVLSVLIGLFPNTKLSKSQPSEVNTGQQ